MRITLLANVALLAAASIASAHGVETQITYNIAGNKIDTRSIIYTSSNQIGQPVPINTITAQRRAYIEPLLYSPIGAGTGWYARPAGFLNSSGLPEHPSGAGPAWQYEAGGTAGANALPGTGWSYSGSTTLPNLSATTFSYKILDGLKVWNGSAFVDPGAEQVQIIGSDGTTSFTSTATNNITTGDVAPTGALQFGITSLSGTNNPHNTMSIRLLGDGTTLAEGDDGIYLLKLALSTTATVGNTGMPVGDSDPFYFVLTKNASYSDAFAAVTSLGIAPSLIQGQVPEPTTLAALSGLAAIASRRARR
jgi:hypothetical protein